jgi:hypothetical protein
MGQPWVDPGSWVRVGFWSTLGCGLGSTFDPDPDPGLNTLDVYVAIHPDLCTKWKPKAKSCTLGYIENTTQQYRVWNGYRIVVAARSNSVFNEESYTRDSKQDLKPFD